MVKYVHIGYPKNFSTSLQRSFFSINPEIYHLGIGSGSNIGYRDSFLSSIFEVYLKTSKGFKYSEVKKRIKDHIDWHYSQAIDSKAKAFGVSSEHFSFSFTYDCLDFETKFERLIELFGEDIEVISIIREQLSLIKSLYKESVRVGFPGSFNDFLSSFYKFQDRNYYYDLRYDFVYSKLVEYVSKQKVNFLFFENYRDPSNQLKRNDKDEIAITSEIASILKLDNTNYNFEHFNAALSNEEVRIKSELNKSTRHDLGNDLYSSAELHRQSQYFVDELQIKEEEEILFKDVLTKRRLLSISKQKAKQIENQELFNCDSDLLNRIKNFYGRGNLYLENHSSLKLPSIYIPNFKI